MFRDLQEGAGNYNSFTLRRNGVVVVRESMTNLQFILKFVISVRVSAYLLSKFVNLLPLVNHCPLNGSV